MLKKLLRNKKGTAEIVGTALFLVILLFFFSNVFLFHNRVSREMDQVVADRTNSAVLLQSISASGNPVPCVGDPIFGGFGSQQKNVYNPPPFQQNNGPPYGMFVGSYTSTTIQDNVTQVLSETGKMVDAPSGTPWDGKQINQDYMCLNATYGFNVGILKVEDLRLMRAITFSFYGYSSDAEGEAVDVQLYDVQKKAFENTGLKILNSNDWYNVTVPNPERYVNLTNGIVKVNYLSDTNGFYYDEMSYGTLYIDFQCISVGPLALSVSDLGGKDLRLEQLWITEANTDNHMNISLSKVPSILGNPVEVWIAAGSSIDIVFGSAVSFDNETLTINYKPPSGRVNFKVLTNLGNTATSTCNFP
jgi:hypothetical protein